LDLSNRVGPGPIGRFSREPNTGGNFNNPILKPEAAAVVKKRSEMCAAAKIIQTRPQLPADVSPYIFRVQEMAVLQKKDEVLCFTCRITKSAMCV